MKQKYAVFLASAFTIAFCSGNSAADARPIASGEYASFACDFFRKIEESLEPFKKEERRDRYGMVYLRKNEGLVSGMSRMDEMCRRTQTEGALSPAVSEVISSLQKIELNIWDASLQRAIHHRIERGFEIWESQLREVLQ